MSPRRLSVFGLCLCLLMVGAVSGGPLKAWRQNPTTSQHVAWVGESLKHMQTVKPGMTRADLLRVFTTEGGLSTRLSQRYVYRECPYFKVDVEFDAVGRPARDTDGRVTLLESGQDIIKKISRPYLEFNVMD